MSTSQALDHPGTGRVMRLLAEGVPLTLLVDIAAGELPLVDEWAPEPRRRREVGAYTRQRG